MKQWFFSYKYRTHEVFLTHALLVSIHQDYFLIIEDRNLKSTSYELFSGY